MEIDFKSEVLKRKKELIQDISELLKINSELTEFDPNRKGAPFGTGIRDALLFMLNLGEKDGFKVKNVDGYAGHIELGESPEFILGIGHLDVVPALDNWTYHPYGAVIEDNRIYGRGAMDDKGPTIAFYYAMKILKELNIPLKKRIKLLLGTDEETAWRGIRHYFSIYPEIPTAGFVPDADFPVIFAEKGITTVLISGDLISREIVSIKGGTRDNMVPDSAMVRLRGNDLNVYLEDFKQYLIVNGYLGSYQYLDSDLLLKITGKSAHGATPEKGLNAIDIIFDFLRRHFTNNLISLVADSFFGDTRGHKLGIAYSSSDMGDLTVNLALVDYEDGHYQLALNIRYPEGISYDKIIESLIAHFSKYGCSLEKGKNQVPLHVPKDSHLVTTLMDVYKKHTSDFTAQPIAIGGGTFARATKNIVAFGPHFKGKPDTIHQKDEYLEIDDIILATTIYTNALYLLAKEE